MGRGGQCQGCVWQLLAGPLLAQGRVLGAALGSIICQCPAAPCSAPAWGGSGSMSPKRCQARQLPGKLSCWQCLILGSYARGQGAIPGGMELSPAHSPPRTVMLCAGLLNRGGFAPQLSSGGQLGRSQEDFGPRGGILQQFLSSLGLLAPLQSLVQSPGVFAGLGSSS